MMEHKCFIFSFADIEVREREFCIVRNGEVLAVEPKAFRVLLFLLRNPHKLITKEELLNAVWSDTAVSENSLTRSIALVRKLLGDDVHEPRYISTVPTVGYRFLCDVRALEDGSVGMNGAEIVPSDPENYERPSFTRGSNPSRFLISAGVGLVIVIALLTGLLAHRRVSNSVEVSAHTRVSGAPISHMRVTQLTNLPGDYRDPTFSPNGEQIAYIWDGENPVRGDLYVQLIGGERPLRLTHTKSGFVCCDNWSSDGREIAFGRCDDNGGAVYIVPALGGPERKVTDVLCPYGRTGDPQWTADGLSLVLAGQCVPGGRLGIVVFSLQTGERRCLHTPPPGDVGDTLPVLSPDRQTVAFLRFPTPNLCELYVVSLSGGSPRQLTFDDENPYRPMWSADGKFIAFESSGQTFRVAAAGGAIEREPMFPYSGVLSPDGRRLARAEPGGRWSWAPVVWRMALSDAGGRVISQEKIIVSTAGSDGVQLSPDQQQIVFQSNRDGRSQIWKSNPNGSAPLQMTSFDVGMPGTPRWSPDGKWVVFDYHTIKHHSQIYMIDSEGRNLHAVTSGDYENSVPSWSRNGKAIYFTSNRTGDWQIWERELSSGQEMQVTRLGGFAAFESYDGKTLYYSRFEGGGIWSMPIDGGEGKNIIHALHRGYWGHFAVTEAGIYFLDSDAEPGPTIMYYNFQTHRSTPVFALTLNPVPWTANLDASRDGRTLFYAQVEFRNSVITMAENFR